MGYTTRFKGELAITPPLKVDDHMAFDTAQEKGFDGRRGESWETISTLPHPDAYCQWIVTKYGASLKWDESEKFYHYEDWLRWLAENFFRSRGYTLNGRLDWQGEDRDDRGTITVTGNVVKAEKAILGNDILSVAREVCAAWAEDEEPGRDMKKALTAAVAKADNQTKGRT